MESLKKEWFVGHEERDFKPVPDSLTLDEELEFSLKSGLQSSLGFEHVKNSRIKPKNFHCAHREFRNEFWSFRGKITDDNKKGEEGEKYFHWIMWRHTELPPNQWDPNMDPKDYSSVKFFLFVQNKVLITECVSEGTGEINFSTDPLFHLQWKNSYVKSKDSKHLFPLEFHWSRHIHLDLSSNKPLFMHSSNGCLLNDHGLGVKKYIYPSVTGSGTSVTDGTNVTFDGCFEHWWEYGMLPSGYPPSTMLRSVQQIRMDTGVHTPTDWFHVMASITLSHGIGGGRSSDSTVQFSIHSFEHLSVQNL